MASNFPTSLDSYTTKVDNTDSVLAAHINDPQDAIEAIEAKLGISSSAVATSIDYFLKNASGEYRNHKHDGTSDDGSASIGPLTGLSLANNVDVGNYDIRAKAFQSDVATGTAPLTVASTTVVSNLNADKLDGLEGSAFVQVTGVQTVAGVKTFSDNANFSGDVDVDGTLETDAITLNGVAVNAANGLAKLDASGYLPTDSVDTASLKTDVSEVSTASGSIDKLSPAGGQYCHYPQLKHSQGSSTLEALIAPGGTSIGTTAETTISMRYYSGTVGTVYAYFTYHTSSGEDFWIFLLVDKVTKQIVSSTAAADHPAYGNSNDFDAQPHPFPNYDSSKYDIVLIEKVQAKAIKDEAKSLGSSVLELVEDKYRVEMNEAFDYSPIHSGQYSPGHAPVLVTSIPDYIKVRKLTPMTKADKDYRDAERESIKIYNDKRFKDSLLKDDEINFLGFTVYYPAISDCLTYENWESLVSVIEKIYETGTITLDNVAYFKNKLKEEEGIDLDEYTGE